MLNSAAVAEAVPRVPGSSTWAVGPACPASRSGLARPDLTMTLVEPMARRVEFLDEAVAELAQARADPAAPDGGSSAAGPRTGVVVASVGTVDVVTARAVAPLPRLVGWCRGLMRPGTQLVALVGARALEELPALLPELTAAGMRDVHPRAVGASARRGCHYRGGHDAGNTVTATAHSPTLCSTWNRHSDPIRST